MQTLRNCKAPTIFNKRSYHYMSKSTLKMAYTITEYKIRIFKRMLKAYLEKR